MRRSQGTLPTILISDRLSDFERKVYRAVLDIPRGKTRSYKWIAVKIGFGAGAARAVGNALNRNPYPGIVPCHRVVKSDDSIGGYYKGISVKRKMLLREGVILRRA